MLCKLRCTIDFDADCPNGITDPKDCAYQMYQDDNFIYEFCRLDADENDECMAKRINKHTKVINFVAVKVVL